MLRSDPLFEQEISQLVNSAIAGNVFPGIEILVAKEGNILFNEVFGTSTPGNPATKLRKNSLFDLASLTKPLATTLAIMHLVDSSNLNLQDSLQKYFPEFKQQGMDQITIRHLLVHTSGLPDWIALFEPEFTPEAGWRKLIKAPLVYNPGESMVYSCLGFIILGELIRQISGETLNDYCRKHIFLPLNLPHLTFNPLSERLDSDIIPTGYCQTRQLELQGQVHDENAALFYGEGGNSGLFGTAANIAKLCAMLIADKDTELQNIISTQTVREMLSNQNKAPLAPRGLGWDYKSATAEYWSCSDLMPSGSLGHLGFTGTSLWFDPKTKIILLLLSNRVIISREENIPLMREFRPKMHVFLLSRFLGL